MAGLVRPPVDIVVPFFGSDDELELVRARLGAIRREPGDTVTVVDNRPWESDVRGEDVLHAPEIQSSYYARNRGVARGTAPWIVFLDGDVDIRPDLLERYFEAEPEPTTAILEGKVVTTPASGRVARYGVLRKHVGNENVHVSGWEYAQTANVAIRRDAFEQIGGFPDGIRSAGDADLCFRLRDRGWGQELRADAIVEHPPRGSLRAMLRQYGRYGAGSQWLGTAYPGFSPPASLGRIALAVVAIPVRAPLARLRDGRDAALLRTIDPLVALAFETGRFQSNEVGAGRLARLRHVLDVLRERRS